MKRGIEMLWTHDYQDFQVLQITKKRGKLTLAEIEDLLRYEESQRYCGHYVIILNCSEATVDGGGLFWEEDQKGDVVGLYRIEDGETCPVCGKYTPPLVSQEVWDAVQRLDNHPSKGRFGSDGELSLFAGVLYCMDCGSSMRILKDYRSRKRHADGHYGTYKAYMCNRYGCGGKAACSSHYINCNTLTKLLLLDIHAKAMLAQNSPSALKEKILAQKNAASLEQTKALRATLAALDKRLAELDKLVVSAYEDKVKGIMPEALCIQLMNRYEAERRDKLEQRTQLTAQLEAHREDECAADSWLNLIRDYTQLEELDRPTLLRLVKRIEVGEKYQVDGETHRDIKIYYNFVGHIEL